VTHTDIALLLAEWTEVGEGLYVCPCCCALHSDGRHKQDCPHDLALSERGFPLQAERDAARSRIAITMRTTLTPPTPSTDR
jgi:hypothetical protein